MKVNYKFISALMISLIIGTVPALSQTVHYVEAGADAIQTAYTAAASGDIIELISEGGIYTFSDQLVVDMDITVRGAANLIDKPVLNYIGTGTSDPFFDILGPDVKVVLQNLEMPSDGSASGGANRAKYAVYARSAVAAGMQVIVIDNCEIYGYPDKFFKADTSNGIDSLFITNNIMYDGEKECLVIGYNGTTGAGTSPVNYALVQGNTFYDIDSEAIAGKNDPTTVLMINHNTFYNIGDADNKSMILIDGMVSVEIKNNIFQMNPTADAGDEFVDGWDVANLFHHNIVWDVTNYDVDVCTVSDTLRADPMFADAANYDFSITAESPAFGFADDGYAAGDLRWDPTALGGRVWYVEDGEDAIQLAYDMANNGDILELTTSGGMYTFTDQVEVEKSITVRGASYLAQKPVLNYIGTGTSDPFFDILGPDVKVVLQNLEMPSDGSASGGANRAKYAVYARSAVPEGMQVIVIDNCEIYGYPDKFFKADTSNGIDSLFITNNIMYDGEKECLVIGYNGTTGAGTSPVNYALVQGNTFYDIDSEAIAGKNDPTTVLMINHNTFYNIGDADNKSMILIDGMVSVEIKNNIFQMNPTADAGDEFVDGWDAANLFHHNIVWDVTNYDVDVCTVSDTLRADPLFVDAANADFRLGDTSPARLFADDGTAAGDPRWDVASDAVNLSLQTIGEGTLTADPAGPWYTSGTAITLTATPAFNWAVSGWAGVSVFPPTTTTATLTITENTTVTVTFVSLTPQLPLELMSYGIGHIVASPLPNVENDMYDEGTVVTLTAVPDSTTWVFDHWGGALAGTTNPATVTMDSATVVEAWFASTITQYTLDIDTVGIGDVNVTPMPLPGFDTYDAGTILTLQANPLLGNEFVGWTGDIISSDDSVSITMDANKVITATFAEISLPDGIVAIDASWDLYDALEFMNNNSQAHTLLLTTSGGHYTTTKESTVRTHKPMTIMGADTLAERPLLTNGNLSSGKDEILRVFDALTLKNVILSGAVEYGLGTKYGVRLAHHSDGDSVISGGNQIIQNVDFRDFKGVGGTGEGHAYKIDGDQRHHIVSIEGCTFERIGYESLRLSDATDVPSIGGSMDSLYVGNCTFNDVDAEGVRYYGVDGVAEPVPVLIENLTFNNSAVRTIYLKDSPGAIVRNILSTNDRVGYKTDRLGDIMDAQGIGTVVSHIDTFNVHPVPIKGGDDATVMEEYIWGVDPRYADEPNGDLTLTAASHLYGMGSDGLAIGDLRWATETPTHVSLVITVAGNGKVTMDPMPEGLTYDPGQVVTLIAVPDSAYEFVAWSGDATGTTASVNVEMSASKAVTATFQPVVGIDPILPKEYSLEQNYPNPFNPTTNIKFALKEAGMTTLTVYDITGRTHAVLVNGQMEAGFYEISLVDPTLASGVYIYRLTSGKFSSVKKMIMLK